MLGDIFEKSEQKQMASRYYARIVRDYPLPSLVPDAKARLTEIKAPIPTADPKAVAWMTAEQNAPRPKNSLIKKPIGLFTGGPGGELRAAARNGAPNLTPESEAPGTEILSAGGQTRAGAGNSIVATVATGSGAAAGGSAENTTGSDTSGTTTSTGTDAGSTPPTSGSAPPTEGTSDSGSANPDPNAAKAESAKPGDGQAQDGSAAATDPKSD